MGERALQSSKKADRRRRVNRLPVVVDAADPTTLDRAAAYVWHDESERVGFLLDAGVRWALLRHVPPSIRLEWWMAARSVQAPEGTRACWDGPEVWLDEVEQRLAGQQWQARKLEKWRKFAAAVADSCARGRRPITGPGLTLPELAGLLGKPDQPISTRYVSQIVRWFRDEALLHVVMPGTRTARLEAPEDETEDERQTREAAGLRAAASRRAAHEARHRLHREHAEAELDAVRAGLTPPPPPDELAAFRGALEEHAVDVDEEARLLRVAQVYELRIPEAADVREAPPERYRAPGVVDLSTARQRRTEARQRARSAAARRLGRPLAETPSVSVGGESSTPSCDLFMGGMQANTSAVVDERAPSGRSEEEVLDPSRGPDQSRAYPTAPLAAAQRLLGAPDEPRTTPDSGVLPRQLTTGVRLAWLARKVGPFVAAGWTDEQLVDVIAYRGGTLTYVPPVVGNPCGWIVAALGRWSPTAPPLVSPEDRDAADQVERFNNHVRDRREARFGAVRLEAAAGCDLCDDQGYRLQDLTGPAIRCHHSPADVDEVEAAAVAVDEVLVGRGRDEVLAILARKRGDVVDPVRAAVLDAARKSAADREALDATRAAHSTYVSRADRRRWTR